MRTFQRNRLSITFTTVIVLLHSSIIDCSTLLESTNHQTEANDNGKSYKVCTTAECNFLAQETLSNMDKNVNPCDNFYKFACGNIRNVTKQNYLSKANENSLESLLMLQMKIMLESPILLDESEVSKNLKQIYKSCIDSSIDEQEQIEAIKARMNEIGGWPVIMGEKWSANNFKFPFDQFIHRKIFNETSNYLDLSCDLLPLRKDIEFFQPTSNWNNGDKHECIKNRGCREMLDTAAMFGAQRNLSTMNELMEIIKFAKDIEKLREITNTSRYSFSYSKSKGAVKPMLRDLLMNKSNQPFLFECIFPKMDRYMINDSNVTVKVELNKSGLELIQLVKNTSKRIQANFVMWRWLKNELHLLPSKKLTATSKSLKNKVENEPQWKDCVNKIQKLKGIKQLYAETFTKNNNRKIAEMFHAMKKSLKKIILRSNWIDSKLRNDLAKEVENITMVDNVEKNELSNGALFSSGTTFNFNFPNHLIYGGIGSLIGHNMSHMFDDFEGEDSPLGAMIKEKKSRYNKQCVINKYNKYTIPGTNNQINGKKTANDNIADIMGLKLAHLAYEEWLRNNGGEESRLPGLEEYNSRQLFWINAANNWCDTEVKLSSETDDHVPNEFRVIGPFSNFNEFAKDFNCPSGESKMNPKRKCQRLSFFF